MDAPHWVGDEDHGTRLHTGRPEPTEVCCDQCGRWQRRSEALHWSKIWWFCGPACKGAFLREGRP